MLNFLKHLLIPHKRNKHRAKILHHSSLLIFIFLLLFSTLAANFIKKSYPEVLGLSYSISENDLLNLVNSERQKNGLSALTINSELDDAARRKAADMFAKNYWAHFAPDGTTSPWGFITASGYTYQYAGENLAKGFTDASSIVTAWMNSPSHRENILSEKYKDVGFAVEPGTLQGEDTVLVVEMFGSTENENVAAIPSASAKTQEAPAAPSPAPIENEPIVKSASAPPQGTEVKPKIDTASSSRAAASVGLTLLAFGFMMDLVIIERKKVPRIVGHNLDHIILIGTFIAFLIILKGGVVI